MLGDDSMVLTMDKVKVESTKLPADVLRDARIVCAVSGEGLADYLGRLLRPIVGKDKDAALAQESGGQKARKAK